ncbi:DUF982 domain-containing protein [Rhizobium leguminosarum]|uniref:DUF982 domain-containing protein n=1 Tax=Rhizobium leguminosarum TaxID=384 RepID=UPI001AE870EF|nr:DUF982 domain-containing protein [Rhizobium leguminosarum]MBP2448653.1 hypothetical protein [Rhizobium leguminosarum]
MIAIFAPNSHGLFRSDLKREKTLSDQWKEPVRLKEDGLLITIETPAQARTWLRHARNSGSAWREALDKCSAAADGRLSSAEARRALLTAAH